MNGTTSGIRPGLRERLREVPLVPLWVGTAVPSMAIFLVARLLDDPCARALRTRVMAVDVVDDHVHQGGLADDARVAESVQRLAEVDPAAAGCDLEFGVHSACTPGGPHLLAKAERLREELDRGCAVLVQEIWGDSLFHEAQARPPAPPCLGKMFPASGR